MYNQPLHYCVWLALIFLGIIYRLWRAVTTRMYYFVTHKNPFAELGPVENVVFVGGFLSFVPSEMPFIHYWGALGSKVAWAPMIGPVSSLSDRACELFYGVFANSPKACIHYRHELCACKDHIPFKPLHSPMKWWVRVLTAMGKSITHSDPDTIKQPAPVPERHSQGIRNALTFIAHSAGGGTVNAMIVMLAYHHKYLLDHGFDVGKLPDSLELDKLSPDFNSKVSTPMFVEDGGRPYVITPNSVKRIIYISSPLGGLEYVRHGANMNNQGYFKRGRLGWWVALLAKLLDRLYGRTNGIIFDFFLEQFPSSLQFARGCDHIARDCIGPNQRELTDRALLVLKAYGIEELRVVTHASVAVRASSRVVNLVRPGACHLLHWFMLAGCGWACDEGEAEAAAFGPHDGVVSVASQMYGHRGSLCQCQHEGGFPLRCTECGLWHLGVDHIEVVGTFGSSMRVRALYADLFARMAQG